MTPGTAHPFRLAVWIVVASEALLFAALFALYVAYRAQYPHAFAVGVGLDIGWMGGLNTIVLLTSSFAMAAGVHAARAGHIRLARAALAIVVVLGLVFLGFKAAEWVLHAREHLVPGLAYAGPAERGVSLFITLYFALTGLHALHMVAGISLVAWARHRGDADIMDCVAIYWHFVDLIWVFLWPMFYVLT